jgi:hypothetical protein
LQASKPFQGRRKSCVPRQAGDIRLWDEITIARRNRNFHCRWAFDERLSALPSHRSQKKMLGRPNLTIPRSPSNSFDSNTMYLGRQISAWRPDIQSPSWSTFKLDGKRLTTSAFWQWRNLPREGERMKSLNRAEENPLNCLAGKGVGPFDSCVKHRK